MYYDLDKQCMEWAVKIAESNIEPVTNVGVGAVIVKDTEIIGTGCRAIYNNFLGIKHKCIHAEHMALMEAGYNAIGATIYVTMEPCTSRCQNDDNWIMIPCCERLLLAGIKRVVVGSYDERFGKGGTDKLRAAGIQVDELFDFQDRIKAAVRYRV
jgi:diaminohydroxyphosphoribosylaminopyrimidine deaminase/5-amino-6-(5-phosphoribosylamino)uracil reductase